MITKPTNKEQSEVSKNGHREESTAQTASLGLEQFFKTGELNLPPNAPTDLTGKRLRKTRKAWLDKNFEDVYRFLISHEKTYENEWFYWYAKAKCQSERLNDEEALDSLRHAATLGADQTRIFHLMGLCYQRTDRFDEAKKSYLSALSLTPNSPMTLSNLSCVLEALGEIDEAMATSRKAVALNDSDPVLIHNHAHLLAKNGQRAQAIQWLERNIEGEQPLPQSVSAYLYLHLFQANEVSNHQTRRFKAVAEKLAAKTRNGPVTHQSAPKKNKLRIGYISSDFRRHSCAFFIEPILRNHSDRFESILFSNVVVSDSYTEHLKALANQSFDVSRHNDAELAELIRSQRLDVLVELNGHTAGNRLPVLSERVAPVQINYLGYAQSTWLPEMDYRLVDWHTDPAGSDANNSEVLLRMPHSFLTYEPLIGCPDLAPPPVLANNHITFGSFNNPQKMCHVTIELWSKLLRELPNSVLRLKSHTLRSQYQRSLLEQAFKKEGIEATRIEFLDPIDDDVAHLKAYNSIDIALDTFPYNGTTTTVEALLMGTPVLTLCGKEHRSRVGHSILNNLGLKELSTETPEGFVKQGIFLAQTPMYLNALSSSLRYLLTKSPMMQPEQFMQHYEDLLVNVLRHQQEKNSRLG